ncbi:uncharacterized protein [Mobula birostris]|uniref:uncharacterized protein isoform X2 n=1 Tax=Mobula birostris TaxID=1983395 RepID=UPI003B27CC66
MALNYLKKIEDLRFPEFSCLCELCDCGQHKCHQNCKKNQSNQQHSVNTDWLLTNYQSSFTRPLNVVPRSSKRPLRTPPHPNPPAMQCETTQRSEFGPKVLKEWKQAGNREQLHSKSIHTKALTLKERPVTVQKCPSASSQSGRLSSRSNTNSKSWKSEPQVRSGERLTTAGVLDLNTTYQVMFQPLPFEKQHTGPKKRPKAKPAPMDLLSSYRKDFPEHRQPKMNLIIPAQDNLQVNRHLPTDFNTIQRNSYIGWDTTRYPRPDPIKYKDELAVGDGLIESDTVTQLEYKMKSLSRQQGLTRPATKQIIGGRFDSETAYKISFKDWKPKTRIRHGDLYDRAYKPPPPGRIESTSVTGRDFTLKNVCKPMYSAKQQKNTPGHHEACSSMPFPMCKLQAYLIHQHLKKMKISNRAVPITCTQ